MHHDPSMAGAVVFLVLMTAWIVGMTIAARRHNKELDARRAER